MASNAGSLKYTTEHCRNIRQPFKKKRKTHRICSSIKKCLSQSK